MYAFAARMIILIAYVGPSALNDTTLPLLHPIRARDGSLMTEVAVPKGTTVAIGIRSTNRYKVVWGEDANEWKPERWLAPLPEAVADAHVPGELSKI